MDSHSRVVDGVFMSATTGMAAFAISANGDLRLRARTGRHRGAEAILGGPQGSRQAAFLCHPALICTRGFLRTTGNSRVEIEGAAHDSYFYDIARDALSRISFDGATHWPVWTPQRVTGSRSGRDAPCRCRCGGCPRTGAARRRG